MLHATSSVHGGRRAAAILAVALTATTALALGALSGPTSADSPQAAAAKKTPTQFAFHSVGYGSRIKGGQLPAKSDGTAFQSLGCTNLAGITKRNRTENSDLEGLGSARNIRTKSWTRDQRGVVSSYGLNVIEKLRLAQEDFGALRIDRLRSLSRAFHDGTGFHAATEVTIGDMTYTETDGTATDLDPPTASEPVHIPGLLKITLGDTRRQANARRAVAAADGMTIRIIPSDTTIVLAHSGAKLTTGVKRGLFFGMAAATEVRAEDKLLRSGKQPLLKMPCLGTDGEVRSKTTTSAGEDSAIGAHKATTRQRGSASTTSASGFEEAAVTSAVVGDGQLSLTGIVGRVNVTRTKTRLVRDIKGTTIGSVVVGGEELALPDLDGFTIPGLVRVDTNITEMLPNGIDVVAVRLTFLDGSERVADLGHARLQLLGSGLK